MSIGFHFKFLEGLLLFEKPEARLFFRSSTHQRSNSLCIVLCNTALLQALAVYLIVRGGVVVVNIGCNFCGTSEGYY